LLAPLMQGDVKGKIIGRQFSIKDRAAFHFNLTPEAINPLIQDQFSLLKETRVEWIFEELGFPIDFLDGQHPVNPCQLGLVAHVRLTEPTQLEATSIGKVTIQELKGVINSPLCQKMIHLQIDGKAVKDQEP